ncbi:MAG: recombination-associated protein RdgC [Deltaproteobacteria bacterium]|nr:recombination-associated protein RdgC [Deltaproteobacteria bacterium]
MGLLSTTCSICQFHVVGERPAGDLAAWVAERLAEHGFCSIEESREESAVGWVEFGNPDESGFAGPHVFQHEHYFAFTLRRDARHLPATLVRQHQQRAEADFLAANPQFRRVPRRQREEMRESVRLDLLQRTLPSPLLVDLVWNTEQDTVSFAGLGSSIIDILMELFNKTFEGLRLVPVPPYARALSVVDNELKEALVAANQATSDDVQELCAANRWLGCDFFLWLIYHTMTDTSEYAVCRPGPLANGECFVAYLDEHLTLAGGDNPEGVQKVAVSGPQDHFQEVRAALLSGKSILDATLYLEQEENLWKMNLKGEKFHFASFRTPKVKIEKDDLVDAAMEREAVFFERMSLLETGIQMFDSVLAGFLRERLAAGWPQQEAAIRSWLEHDGQKA